MTRGAQQQSNCVHTHTLSLIWRAERVCMLCKWWVYLDNAHIGGLARFVDGNGSHPLDPVLDFVGDVGHHLHRLAEVVALALTSRGA
jgi:hypothetical protein